MLLNIPLDESDFDLLSRGERVIIKLDDVVVELIRRPPDRCESKPNEPGEAGSSAQGLDDALVNELFNPDLDDSVKIAGDGRWECRKCKNWNASDSSCIGEPTAIGPAVCGEMPPIISLPDPARYTCPRCGNVNHFDSLCVAQVDGKMCGFSPLEGNG